jgi:hypothetical protein
LEGWADFEVWFLGFFGRYQKEGQVSNLVGGGDGGGFVFDLG